MSPFLTRSSSKTVHCQYKVLIIDNNDDNLLYAQYAVESLAYKAIPVPSAQNAIDIALVCLPDIILMDILLDGANGIDVMHRLKQHRQLAKAPIIAVTAFVQPHNREKYIDHGFTDYLVKPYMLDDLAFMLSKHLSKPSFYKQAVQNVKTAPACCEPDQQRLTG